MVLGFRRQILLLTLAIPLVIVVHGSRVWGQSCHNVHVLNHAAVVDRLSKTVEEVQTVFPRLITSEKIVLSSKTDVADYDPSLRRIRMRHDLPAASLRAVIAHEMGHALTVDQMSVPWLGKEVGRAGTLRDRLEAIHVEGEKVFGNLWARDILSVRHFAVEYARSRKTARREAVLADRLIEFEYHLRQTEPYAELIGDLMAVLLTRKADAVTQAIDALNLNLREAAAERRFDGRVSFRNGWAASSMEAGAPTQHNLFTPVRAAIGAYLKSGRLPWNKSEEILVAAIRTSEKVYLRTLSKDAPLLNATEINQLFLRIFVETAREHRVFR